MVSSVDNLSQLESPVEILNCLLEVLTEKERLVITQRYGLNGSETRTLASIGNELGVTRERIRQVQNYALKKLKRNAKNTNLEKLHKWLVSLLQENGGILSEIAVNRSLGQEYPNNAEQIAEIRLAAILTDEVIWEYNKVDFIPHFRLSSISFKMIKEICDIVIKKLNKTGEVLKSSELMSEVQKEYKEKLSVSLKKKTIMACLFLDRRITANDDGISLTSWRHVNPRTLFDKIQYVLNDIEEPMHFRDISKIISQHKFDNKEVSVQAVHNELINNPIFILIGRGIYALKTWGYKEGTVSDVIQSILEKKGPMHIHDITQEVLQRRKVKPITIQINLNSKKAQFRKIKDGRYDLIS